MLKAPRLILKEHRWLLAWVKGLPGVSQLDGPPWWRLLLGHPDASRRWQQAPCQKIPGQGDMCHEELSAGRWRPWARTGLQPYLRIWEGFLEEVTSRDLKDEYELVMQREETQRGELQGTTLPGTSQEAPSRQGKAGPRGPSTLGTDHSQWAAAVSAPGSHMQGTWVGHSQGGWQPGGRRKPGWKKA